MRSFRRSHASEACRALTTPKLAVSCSCVRIRVLLFAGIRARLGVPHLEVDLLDQAGTPTVAQLRQQLVDAHPELADALGHCRIALDQEFASEDQTISEHVEVALIPPVSGGAPILHLGSRSCLREDPLSLAEVVAAVEHRDAGGIATFTGNVREHSRGKLVRWLEYEAYAPMAVAKMDEIALAIEAELPGTRVAVQHRIGRLEIGEAAVVIAASAPHRDEAFRACRAVIERLKAEVPIWKKEVDSEGQAWIGQGP
jgi:MoaE-MoaD fusion protein